jgi:hypothetical protein
MQPSHLALRQQVPLLHEEKNPLIHFIRSDERKVKIFRRKYNKRLQFKNVYLSTIALAAAVGSLNRDRRFDPRRCFRDT